MTIKALQEVFKSELSSIYPLEEINSFFYLLSETFVKKTRLDIALAPNEEVSKEDRLRFTKALEKLKTEYPIQYIIGETVFMELPFLVNEHVLIPRPETEELVSWILEDHVLAEKLEILDIGSGSGCIPISLAKQFTIASIKGLDISEEAIEVAQKNAHRNNVSVDFIKEDILKATALKQNLDIIISNPPYVRESEKTQMKNNVLKFEPRIALYVSDEDPLLFYRKIAELALKSLKPSGKLYFEINQYLASALCELLRDTGFIDIKVKKDIYGADRMIRAIKK